MYFPLPLVGVVPRCSKVNYGVLLYSHSVVFRSPRDPSHLEVPTTDRVVYKYFGNGP